MYFKLQSVSFPRRGTQGIQCIELPKLMCLCLYLFLYETLWEWSLGAETCRSYLKLMCTL